MPEPIPGPIDLRGAQMVIGRNYVDRPDSLRWKGPVWLKEQYGIIDSLQMEADSLDAMDSLIDSLRKEDN